MQNGFHGAKKKVPARLCSFSRPQQENQLPPAPRAPRREQGGFCQHVCPLGLFPTCFAHMKILLVTWSSSEQPPHPSISGSHFPCSFCHARWHSHRCGVWPSLGQDYSTHHGLHCRSGSWSSEHLISIPGLPEVLTASSRIPHYLN